MTLNLVMPCAEVLGHQEARNAVMQYIKDRMYDTGHTWKRDLAPASLTYTSPCGRRIIKIDNCKIVIMDTKTQDGWKSQKFTCKTVEEAWRTVVQSIKVHDIQSQRKELH